MTTDRTTVELLIHEIVQQTTVLIATLATAGGTRTPLAQIADLLFVELARELKRQGVSTKVSADMFGLGLRTYQRKLTRLGKRPARRGRPLREAILELVATEGPLTRPEILRRFPDDNARLVKALLRDLERHRPLFSTGRGGASSFRNPPQEGNVVRANAAWGERMDDLLVATIYREGPLTANEIAERFALERTDVEAALARLSNTRRVQAVHECDGTAYRATTFEVALGACVGWEAAVREHFSALVSTVVARLASNQPRTPDERVGASTYAMDLWQGHPLADEVYGALSRFRATLADLRTRAAAFSGSRSQDTPRTRALIYVGQSLVELPSAEPGVREE